jgi:5-methyltetrahydropteroyltriglutamate--homocysteine methyltransferase
MKRSTERILTTHVGSLARPDALVPILKAKDRGQPYDRDAWAALVRAAVTDVVRKQAEAGIDVVTDGEQGKASFFGYIVERFNGFTRIPAPPGQEGNTRAASREYRRFPTTTRGPSASPSGRAAAAATGGTVWTSARGRSATRAARRSGPTPRRCRPR